MNARTLVNVQDFSVGVATVSTPILPAYFGRNFLLIKNNGTGSCAVNLRGGTAALATIGSVQLASGQQLLFQKNVPQNAITAISASTSFLTVQSDDSFALPSFILQTSPPPSVDLNFLTGQYWVSPLVFTTATQFLTTTRATPGTDLLPTSAAGATITTFANNIPRLTASGLLVEEARTNLLINSTAPAASQSPTCGVATFVLWMNGTGSATATAGTATAAALPLIATQGVPVTFAVTVGGTVVVTTTGNVNAYQLESASATGPWGTSLIVTAGASATRNIDVVNVTTPFLNGPASTIFGQGTPLMPIAANQFNVVAATDNNTTNNRIQIYRSSTTGDMDGLASNAGVGGVMDTTIVWNNSTRGRLICASASGDQATIANGSAPVTGATAWPPAAVLNRLDIGQITALTAWNGFIERVAFWPTARLSNATMRSLTS